MHTHSHGHGHQHGGGGKLAEGAGHIRRIANIGIGINIVLSVVQVIVGWLAGSLALMTDGIHTLSDMFTDLTVLVAVHFGGKKADSDHPWGHGRFETFAAAFVSLSLMGVGGLMIYKAITAIGAGRHTEANAAVLFIALVCVASKEWLYWAAVRVAKKTNSTAVYANAWHHRSDAFSSVAVALGYVGLKLGWWWSDSAVAAGVGAMVVMVGVKVFNGGLSEFAEKAVDAEIIADIHKVLKENPAIHDFHKLRTRSVGREVFIDLHILVDRNLTVEQGHTIAENVTEELGEHLTVPANIIVHVEPDTEEIREAAKEWQ